MATNVTGPEIKVKIDEYNAQLAQVVTPAFFMLNEEASKIYSQITSLQEICPHKFQNEVCIYCGKGRQG